MAFDAGIMGGLLAEVEKLGAAGPGRFVRDLRLTRGTASWIIGRGV